MAFGIRSLIGPATFRSVRSFQCSTPKGNIRRKPESSFGENQLLQRSISFSLQPTSHPRMLHNSRVRPSLLISKEFSLLMGSSRCFGSDTNDKRAIHTRFRYGSILLGLSQAVCINSLAHSSIGTPSRLDTISDFAGSFTRLTLAEYQKIQRPVSNRSDSL